MSLALALLAVLVLLLVAVGLVYALADRELRHLRRKR